MLTFLQNTIPFRGETDMDSAINAKNDVYIFNLEFRFEFFDC